MPGAGVGSFVNDRSRDRYFHVYDDIRRRRWPAQAAPADVPTTFGVTRTYRAAGAGIPLVLLPGAGGNALTWHPHLARLLPRPVVAIDPPGEPGRSIQDRPLRDGADWAGWLDQVLDGLGVDRAHLAGVSFGGWVAMQHTLSTPGRVASVTLIDPAGFGRVTGRFLGWIVLGGLAALGPAPIRRAAARALRNATLLDADAVRMVRASIGFRRRHLNPPELTDGQLRRVAVPTLTLLGQRSQLYDASAVAARIRANLPGASAETVPDAGHDLAIRCVDLVCRRIVEFTAEADAAA